MSKISMEKETSALLARRVLKMKMPAEYDHVRTYDAHVYVSVVVVVVVPVI